jgi:hypothetical protein
MAQELSPRLHQRHTAARLAIDPPIMTSEQLRRWRRHRSGGCRYRHYARSPDGVRLHACGGATIADANRSKLGVHNASTLARHRRRKPSAVTANKKTIQTASDEISNCLADRKREAVKTAFLFPR